MRKKLICGNWKMHTTIEEAMALTKSLLEGKSDAMTSEMAICVPFVSLHAVKSLLLNGEIALGAQNVHFEEKGAFTGEISPVMLESLGCKYVICGHSERREIFGETDAIVNRKVQAILAHHMTPILCVGEDLAQREAGKAVAVVEEQLMLDLQNISKQELAASVIAYEPIWAIGTGKTATSEEAQEMCKSIREYIAKLYDQETADAVRILYGGSVKAANAKEILSQGDIDGALVGGASLSAADFLPIAEA